MYYYFDGFKVDVFGYDPETGRYDYCIESPYYSRCRQAKARYKAPDKRNEWRFPFGTYIYIIDNSGNRHRLFLDR